MNIDFSQPVNRWNTHSAKWDLLTQPYGKDAISLSVADMEFRTASPISQAICSAAELGCYGYTEVFEDFANTAVHWQIQRHNWSPDPSSVIFFPRVVQCLSSLLHSPIPYHTNHPPQLGTEHKNWRVSCLFPAYDPLIEVIELSDAQLIPVELVEEKGKYVIDFTVLRQALEKSDLFILCNPHNPTGRVWTSEELHCITKIAKETGTIIFSDDVHADFLRGVTHPYTPLASIAPDLWESGHIIHCASPGKTFNLAGLESTAIFSQGDTAKLLHKAKRAYGLHNPNYFAIPGAIAAWTYGEEYLEELLPYIDSNIGYTVNYFRTHLPRAIVYEPEGTYLVWIDLRSYIYSAEDLTALMHKSKVVVSRGEDFGSRYLGYIRINTALPRTQLEEALSRLSAHLNP